jgi:hypothetical protein
LIEQLVNRYGVAILANVGNIADWNVCKTGLINELRKNPTDCFVLHDLSAESERTLGTRLSRFDALVVLDSAAFAPGALAAAPGLNRAYPSIWSAIEADKALVRPIDLELQGLPQMKVYVRRREGSRAHVPPEEVSQIGAAAMSMRK